MTSPPVVEAKGEKPGKVAGPQPQTPAPSAATAGGKPVVARAADLLTSPKEELGTAERSRMTGSMQQSVGNARVGRMFGTTAKHEPDGSGHDGTGATVQRSVASGAGRIQRKLGDEHDLTAPGFAGDGVLEGCYDGEMSRYLRSGSAGESVRKVQQALIDLGYSMPISTQKTGTADGIFGSETNGVVKQFQKDQGLEDIDGIVGKDTITRLDGLLGSSSPRKEPEIDATEAAVGQRIVDQMDAANKGARSENEGIWYARNYRDAYPGRWKESYMDGYANPLYFSRVGAMEWVLNPKMSASAAIKAWLKGLTIAECYTTVTAIEYDAMRAVIGDKKFDEIFGSTEKKIAPEKRLRISLSGVAPIDEYLKKTDAATARNEGTFNARPVKPGQWYYFYNHPKYLLKHPFGEWQGENSIYMGEDPDGNQMWSGLGTANAAQTDSRVTEDEMLSQMVSAYNPERDPDDLKELTRIKTSHGGVLPKEYVYEEDGGELPRTIDKGRILSDPPYTINGVTRKGGFDVGAGVTLDLDKLKTIRDAP